ncbi:MAG: outer membrane beta-barrel protein [Burkholderiales bacterium]|nr:outer membrane beta-barrel protein [Burkholderiales bacterium]
MSKKSLLAASLLIAGLALSAQATAQQRYLGAAIGTAKWNIDCTGATACDKTDTSYQILTGYNFSPTWAIEGSFFSLGETSASNAGVAGAFKSSGVDVGAVVKTPAMKGFVGLAKMGLAYVKGEVVGSVGSLVGSGSKYSVQPMFGFGVMYQVNQDVNVRAEYTYRKVKVADMSDATGNVSTFTLGAQSAF